MLLRPPAGFVSRIRPQMRMSAFYFWLMGTQAVATPYLAIWLSERGLSKTEIGIANAAPLCIVILLNFLIGRIADSKTGWRRTIVLGSLIATLPPFLLGAASGPIWLTLCWALVLVPMNLTIPVADAASARIAARSRFSFSRIRVWGTIGYMLVTGASGAAVGEFGTGVFVPMLAAVALFRLASALALPEMDRRASATERDPSEAVRSDLAIFRRSWFVLPVAGSALITAAHAMQNAFGAFYWRLDDLNDGQIAFLWMVAAGCEIAAMYFYPYVVRCLSARLMLLIAGLVGVVRWAGLGLEPGFGWLVALQALHMITFGISYLATISFLIHWTSDDIAARAQSILSVLRQTTTVIALLGIGYVAEFWGAQTYFLAAATSFAGALCIVLSLCLKPPLKRPPA